MEGEPATELAGQVAPARQRLQVTDRRGDRRRGDVGHLLRGAEEVKGRRIHPFLPQLHPFGEGGDPIAPRLPRP